MSDRSVRLTGEEATTVILALEAYAEQKRSAAKTPRSVVEGASDRRAASIALEVAQRVRLA